MNSRDLLQMSFSNLMRRKTRTILTLLGVVIGTSSIVIMLSLGIAMDQSFKESLAKMGSLNVIDVHSSSGYAGPMMISGSSSRTSDEVKLDDNAVARLEKIPGVDAVMPSKYAYMRIAIGKMVGDVNVIGINPELMEAFDFKVEQGRLLSAGDKDTLVFGKQVAYNFRNPRLRNQEFNYRMFNGENAPPPPVDLISSKLIMTSNSQYGERRSNIPANEKESDPPPLHQVKGVGILSESNGEKDYSAYMNIAVLEDILKEDKKVQKDDTQPRRRSDAEEQYQNIKVKVKDIGQVASIQEQIKGMGFQASSLSDMVKSMKETSRKLQAILGGIGAVSLLVAAIGITNTMIMSIYERTREIGVIKVLGARLGDIKNLFLLEAAMIGFGGGCIGLIFSCLVSYGLNKITAGFMGNMGSNTGISVITFELGLSAVIFATIVGIISGYSPARRAMKLSALEAIRSE
ncbi:MAG: ABC transporter permease [Syntrophomonadaceae bacterium]|nr:ABC transporter permease [Syntrophomonadaceae bacterium]